MDHLRAAAWASQCTRFRELLSQHVGAARQARAAERSRQLRGRGTRGGPGKNPGRLLETPKEVRPAPQRTG